MKKQYNVRQKSIFTAIALLAVRLVHLIPAPGVDTGFYTSKMNTDSLFGLMNVVSGNGLSGMSILALSIGPYISASIIMQLMGEVFPKVKELRKGKPEERKYLDRITFCLTAAVALLEGAAMSYSFGKQGMFLSGNMAWKVLVPVIWTASSTVLAACGKKMSDDKERFIGNGVTLILLTNILASYPGDMMEYVRMVIAPSSGKGMAVALSVLGIVLLFAFTVYVHSVEKRITVVYTSKAPAGKGSVSTFPVRLCPGGVVPVIFASGVLSLVVLLFRAAGKGDAVGFLNTANWFHAGSAPYTWGALVYAVLIFAFSFYYTELTASPGETEENIRKGGGVIPGVHAGKPTAEYLKSEMRAMILLGAAALTAIAMVPVILSGVFGVSRLSFLGTSIIITVSTVLETKKEVALQKESGKYIQKVRNGGLFGNG